MAGLRGAVLVGCGMWSDGRGPCIASLRSILSVCTSTGSDCLHADVSQAEHWLQSGSQPANGTRKHAGPSTPSELPFPGFPVAAQHATPSRQLFGERSQGSAMQVPHTLVSDHCCLLPLQTGVGVASFMRPSLQNPPQLALICTQSPQATGQRNRFAAVAASSAQRLAPQQKLAPPVFTAFTPSSEASPSNNISTLSFAVSLLRGASAASAHAHIASLLLVATLKSARPAARRLRAAMKHRQRWPPGSSHRRCRPVLPAHPMLHARAAWSRRPPPTPPCRRMDSQRTVDTACQLHPGRSLLGTRQCCDHSNRTGLVC